LKNGALVVGSVERIWKSTPSLMNFTTSFQKDLEEKTHPTTLFLYANLHVTNWFLLAFKILIFLKFKDSSVLEFWKFQLNTFKIYNLHKVAIQIEGRSRMR